MKSFIKLTILLTFLTLSGCKNEDTSKDDIPATVSKDSISPEKTKYIALKNLDSYVKNAPPIKHPENLGKPFDTLQFNKVIAYDYKGSEEPYPSVIEEGDFNPVILKQQALTEGQISKLIKCLTTTSSYGEASASCFVPHLGFLFFNNNKIVYNIDICLDCNAIHPSSDIPAIEAIKVEYSFGFSKSGKQDITNLCTELDFYYGSQKYFKE